MLSAARAERLRPLLDRFLDARPWPERVAADPVEFPHRYRRPRDVEVAGLLAASLAYGRAGLFKPKIAGLLEGMGASPAAFVSNATPRSLRPLLNGFVYRFNLPADVAVLLLGMGRALQRFGSLEAAFLHARDSTRAPAEARAAFARLIRDGAPRGEVLRRLGPTRGLAHLLPLAQGGAAKRLNLYLRWMVRGPDAIDLGVWRTVRPSELVIPLDTHVGRIARWLGLTRRADLSWRTAEEITAGLRLLDPQDPTKYDFALCHYGMSGACPVVPRRSNCELCSLRAACSVPAQRGWRRG